MIALLDTHVLLWWFEDDHAETTSRRRRSRRSRLPLGQARWIRRARPENPLRVCDITLWEIATLVELGRVRLALPLRDWLEQATAPPLVERVGVSPAIAAEVAQLPSTFHRDPADRIIVATARVLGATLLTCDTRIIDAKLIPTAA